MPREHERASTTVRRGVRGPSRGIVAGAVLGLVLLVSAACGGGGTPEAASEEIPADAAASDSGPAGEFASSRPGVGITAAGAVARSGPPCPEPGDPGGGEAVRIALVAPDVHSLEVIGLGDLVFDTPGHVVDAYVNKINSLGGINGHCFEFHFYEYGFTDPAGDFGRICTDLPQQAPLVLLGIGLNEAVLGCATLAAGIPTIGLYSQWPEATFSEAAGLLLVDHGAVGFLLRNALEAAVRTGALTAADRTALLHQVSANPATEEGAHHEPGQGHAFGGHAHDAHAPEVMIFDAATEHLGLQAVGWVAMSPDFSGTAVLVIEQQFRETGGDIFDPDADAFERSSASMPPDIARLLAAMRQHFVSTAVEMRDAGVTAVVAASDWSDVRSLMRAAELVDWYPKWIINDSHYALLVLTDAPKAQGLNLVQVSSRRAADDPIEGLDRGCLSLRNADTDAAPFSHRYHTDAWSLMTSTCDYLDVVFGAVARVDGPLTREAFLAALSNSSYEAAHGSLVRFAEGDPYGSDSFRVLSADPDCVLNEWGCMRAISDWLEPVAAGNAAHRGETADG